jgi:presenilin-like A22 family membrane protease
MYSTEFALNIAFASAASEMEVPCISSVSSHAKIFRGHSSLVRHFANVCDAVVKLLEPSAYDTISTYSTKPMLSRSS